MFLENFKDNNSVYYYGPLSFQNSKNEVSFIYLLCLIWKKFKQHKLI